MHPLQAEILAGCVGGAAKTLALYPLDTMVTLRELRLQPEIEPWHLQHQYRGCGMTILGLLPYAVLFHTAFYFCNGSLPTVPYSARQMLAGLCGSIAAATVGVPVECIKHRVQLRAAEYETPRLAIETTLRNEGLNGLFSGFGSTMARNAPYNALHFGIFAAASHLAAGLALHSGARSAVAGAAAGALTALLTTPLDLINTRLQTQALGAAAGAKGERYRGVVDAFRRIVREEGGPAALMQGALFRVVQYAPASLIFFFFYEAVKKNLLGVVV